MAYGARPRRPPTPETRGRASCRGAGSAGRSSPRVSARLAACSASRPMRSTLSTVAGVALEEDFESFGAPDFEYPTGRQLRRCQAFCRCSTAIRPPCFGQPGGQSFSWLTSSAIRRGDAGTSTADGSSASSRARSSAAGHLGSVAAARGPASSPGVFEPRLPGSPAAFPPPRSCPVPVSTCSRSQVARGVPSSDGSTRVFPGALASQRRNGEEVRTSSVSALTNRGLRLASRTSAPSTDKPSMAGRIRRRLRASAATPLHVLFPGARSEGRSVGKAGQVDASSDRTAGFPFLSILRIQAVPRLHRGGARSPSAVSLDRVAPWRPSVRHVLAVPLRRRRERPPPGRPRFRARLLQAAGRRDGVAHRLRQTCRLLRRHDHGRKTPAPTKLLGVLLPPLPGPHGVRRRREPMLPQSLHVLLPLDDEDGLLAAGHGAP